MCKMMDEAVTCTRWWCVQKREENVYYTTICMMPDETACNNVHNDNAKDDG